MACFMEGWELLHDLDLFRGKSSEEACWVAMDVYMNVLRLYSLSLAKDNIMDKGYMVIESLSDHLHSSPLQHAFLQWNEANS